MNRSELVTKLELVGRALRGSGYKVPSAKCFILDGRTVNLPTMTALPSLHHANLENLHPTAIPCLIFSRTAIPEEVLLILEKGGHNHQGG